MICPVHECRYERENGHNSNSIVDHQCGGRDIPRRVEISMIKRYKSRLDNYLLVKKAFKSNDD